MSCKTFRVDWFPHDSLLDFSYLKAEEIGVLMQIINLIYAQNKLIDNDPKFIGKNCNLGPTKTARIINTLIKKGHIYIAFDNKIGKKRCDKELDNVSKRREKYKNNGEKGAKKRWDNKLNQEDRNNQAIPNSMTSINTNNSQSKKTNNQYPSSSRGELGMFGSDKNFADSAFGSLNFDIDHYLSDEARQKAREAAPGWDQYALMKKYNNYINEKCKEKPIYPNKAYPAWCAKITKGKPPS